MSSLEANDKQQSTTTSSSSTTTIVIENRKQGVNHSELSNLLKAYPISDNTNYDYGTAGFRYHYKVLPPIFIRMGILACLKSANGGGEHVGIMVTASHNPECDNGIKLSAPNGGMLDEFWEQKATTLANNSCTVLDGLTNDLKENKPMIIHIGRDTRSHSLSLSLLAIEACCAMGATVINHGCVTTPQLHWSVLQSNPYYLPTMLMECNRRELEQQYLKGMASAYTALLCTATEEEEEEEESTHTKRTMIVDCACGVGGIKVPLLNTILQCQDNPLTTTTKKDSSSATVVELVAVNVPGEGPLNEMCGAEFVQKQQQFPKRFTSFTETTTTTELLKESYAASLDGDADRIVFHYSDSPCDKLQLLDGDKIAVLIATFIKDELLNLQKVIPEASNISCGVVQTAYANGASTMYLKNTVQTKVTIAKTGVKFVHKMAESQFDIGIYFEANGHGSILFGPNFYQMLALADTRLLGTNNKAWQRLRLLPKLVNPAIGDALTDLLLVDAILVLKGWSVSKWNSLYTDVPSLQYKIQVQDKSILTVNDNETKVLTPSTLQPALDAAVASLSTTTSSSSAARTFVRPSGTENVVRIYVEAMNEKDVNQLASKVIALVHDLCNGVGDIPNLPL